MEKQITLYLSDGSEVEITSFEYSAQRMSGAPTIKATVKSFVELDISTRCYTIFNGEKYYVKQVPTKIKDNTDARYKYEVGFVSERDILDNIYFYDASKSSSSANARISHNTTFHWSGTLYDYIDKLNESLKFSFNDAEDSYRVSLDAISNEYEAEYKFISLDNQYFTAALQEIYNTYGVPYYFVGKTIYVGYQGSSLNEDAALDYGYDKGLLSITKSNANFKVVNKCTATGSSENLPYYYPNKSADGEHDVTYNIQDFGTVDVNFDVLSKHVELAEGEALTYNAVVHRDDNARTLTYRKYANGSSSKYTTKEGITSFLDTVGVDKSGTEVSMRFNVKEEQEYKIHLNYAITLLGTELNSSIKSYGIESVSVRIFALNGNYRDLASDSIEYGEGYVNFSVPSYHTGGSFDVDFATVFINFKVAIDNFRGSCMPVNMSFYYSLGNTVSSEDFFYCENSGKRIPYSTSGIRTSYQKDKATITIGASKNLMPFQQTLMPSIYRATLGAERFYKASNAPYTVEVIDDDKNTLSHEVKYLDENGNNFVFANPYDATTMNYREHTFSVDDLKPSIKETEYRGQRIDIIEDVAFDKNDNNELNEKDEYKHSYFYVKLRPLGFNLFSHASESGDMTISFTSGDCTACSFTIGVNDLKKNTIQVDSKGDLQFDSEGNVLKGNPQDKQNDTTDNYVWIALKKEEQTYGTIMPDKSRGVEPNAGDSFVILNINLPFYFIEAAEQKLENKIKEYLMGNNSEKFKFSIKFSRIFLAENDDFRNNLNENSRILINDSNYGSIWLYVSSFYYKINSGEPLPEITVSLVDTLSTPQAPLQNVINQVKEDVQSSINSVDIVAMGARSFIRKDTDDETTHSIKVNHLNIVEDTQANGNLSVGGDEDVSGSLSVARRAMFGDNVEVYGDITSSNYEEILGEIKGAKIDQQGNGVFKSLRANSMEVFTMIYNQMKISSAYTSFDDAGTITDVEELSNGNFKITFDQTEFSTKDDDGNGIQPFYEDDILHGIVNNVNQYSYSNSGECWMYVVSTPTSVGANLEQNQIIATMYGDAEVPTPTNIKPTTNMVLVHKGNRSDDNKERQSTFYISSKDGNFIQLLDVNSPKLLEIKDGYSNYGVVIGKLPSDLFEYIRGKFNFVNKQDPMLYAKYAVVENLLQLDYLGRPIKTENYRGDWNEHDSVYNPYVNTPSSYDSVTYKDQRWKCENSETTEIPGEGHDWSILIASAAIYTIEPSVTGIHLNKQGELNTTSLNICVRYNGKYSEKIDDQQELNKLNLSVWFSIDDSDERHRLVVGGSYAIEAEEGGYAVVGEDDTDSVLITLESETIDLSAIKEKINLFLVLGADENGYGDDDLHSLYIPVTKDGDKGDSVYITNTDVFYTYSDDGVNHPTEGWTEEIPSVADGVYIWSLTRVEYSDGNVTETYSVSRKGIDGGGILRAEVFYYQSEENVNPEDITDWGPFPSKLEDGWWLYTKTETEYTDGIDMTKSYSVSQIGTGSYYAGLQEYYAVSNSYSSVPNGYPTAGQYASFGAIVIDTAIWSTNRPQTLNSDKPYLWNFSISYDSKGVCYVVAPVCIGNFAKGITSVKELYAISAYSKPNSTSAEYPTDITDWVDENQDAAPTENKPYQWNKTETTYNDGSSATIYHVSAVKGNKGDQGQNGKDAPATNPNLLPNSNFDVYDENGALKHWNSLSGQVVLNGYGEYNSLKTLKTGVNARMDFPFVIKKGRTYTVSCMAKNVPTEGGSQVQVTGIVLANMPYDDVTIVSTSRVWFGTPSSRGSVDVYFRSTPDWEQQNFNFTYNPRAGKPDELSEVTISLYCWNGYGEYSKLKIEEGDAVTPYNKNDDDLKGDTGPSIYLKGKWNKDTTYAKENNCVPVVDEDGIYYILIENESIGYRPSTTPTHWKPFQHFQYLYSEFLLANEARFGSKDGGVFYGNKLMSSKDADGKYFGDQDWDSENPMLSIDFKEGKISAQNANIRGHIEATSGSIDSIEATNIDVTSGTVGGFNINDGSIGTVYSGDVVKADSNWNKQRLQFFTPQSLGKEFAVIGTNTLLGVANEKQSLLRLTTSSRSSGSKYGAFVDVSAGLRNYAVYAENGGILSKNWVVSTGFSKISDGGQLTMQAANPFLWIIDFTGKGVILPQYTSVQECLSLDSNESFAIRITIVGGVDSSANSEIYGHAATTGGYDPIIINNDGDSTRSVSIGKGDVLEFLLVYYKKNNETKYYAYVLNSQYST